MAANYRSFTKRHKLAIQTTALLLTMVAVVPIYVGLQGDSNSLAWFGVILAGLGMAIGLLGT